MDISIVIPVYNEEESVPILNISIHKIMGLQNYDWELLYINDGSIDGSLEILAQLAEKDPGHTKVINLLRNYGQTAALSAGLDYAKGEIIITMDADLQNDPLDIPSLLEKINEGYDLVSGWRKTRKDNSLKRTFPSVMANKLISGVTGVPLHDYGCTLKAFRRENYQGFRLYGEMHRFIPAYAGWAGAKIAEIPVNHRPGEFGETKYGVERTAKGLLDLITLKFLLSFSQKPIYLFGGTGLGFITISFGLVVYLMERRIFLGEHLVESPFLLMPTMLFILGFQSILLGLIAELLARTYHESQAKPTIF